MLLKYGFDENKLAKEKIETIKEWISIIYNEDIQRNIELYELMVLSHIKEPNCLKVPHIKRYFAHKRQAWRQRKKSG